MIIIIIAIISLSIYYVQSRLYVNRCFDKVSFSLDFKDAGVFEGEQTELTEVVGNKKWLSLWWIIARFAISEKVVFDKAQESKELSKERGYRRDLFSLPSYQRVKRHFTVTGSKRGCYVIDGATLTTGDLFGRHRFLVDVPIYTILYVYPCLVNTGEMLVPFERMMGEILTRRRLIEDPFLIRGIRDYSTFDSFKKINWNATARTGQFKVNEYDFTSSREIKLLLNAERFNASDMDGTIEESIRIAASIASECISGGIPVGLVSNGRHILTGENISVDTSNSPGYTAIFYQTLACLDTWDLTGPFAETIKEESIKGNTQPLYVLISQYFGQDLQEEVAAMRRNGFNVYWILPKYTDTVLKVGDMDNIYVWDVTDR